MNGQMKQQGRMQNTEQNTDQKKRSQSKPITVRRYLWDGSYTLEAAFIVPMILGMIYAWMFQLFYLRDQVVMAGILEEMAVECQMGRDAGEEIDIQAYQQTLQSCLWVARVTSLEEKKGTLQTKCTLKASAYWGISLIDPFLGQYFSSNLNGTVKNVRPEKLLRLAGESEE